MRSFVKWNLVVLALAMSLAFATGAYADTLNLSWSFSDPDDLNVYGNGTMTIDTSMTYPTPDTGSGSYYLVTDMTGNVNIDSTGGAISNILSESDPTLLGTAGNDPSGLLQYDNLINLIDPSSPYMDSRGIIFYLDGIDYPIDYPFELCGPSIGVNTCFDNNPTAGILDYNDAGDRGYYQVEFSVETTAVPEPSVLALLTLGLVG
jgi:hypothetical protein